MGSYTIASNGIRSQLQSVAHRKPRMPAERGPLVSSTVGERCLEAAFRSGYRKAHLAEMVGVSWQAVNTWAKGTTPSIANVKRVASVTGYSVEEIMGWASGQDPPFESWQAFKATAEYRASTDQERRAVAAIMWPHGKEPTLTSYLLALQAIRAAADKTAIRSRG